MNNNLNKIAKILKKAKNVAIFSHIEPDFDAIGSALALKHALILRNINADYICSETQTPTAYAFFGDNFAEKNFDKNKYDTFVCVDNPSPSRCEYSDVFATNTNSIILDHHKNMGFLGRYNYIDTTKSSCCEIIFSLLKQGNFKINKEIASFLYAGLSTDTNSFTNSNTTENSFFIAHKLIKIGADSKKLNEIFFKSVTEKEIMIKKFIYENYKLKNNIAYCLISLSDIKKLKANKKEFSHVSSDLIKINKAKIAFSIIEKDKNTYSISFRSKIGYPIQEIAEKLGGGGHLFAAACKIYDNKNNIDTLLKKVLKIIMSTYDCKRGNNAK